MNKLKDILLCSLLALALMACGSKAQETDSDNEKDDMQQPMILKAEDAVLSGRGINDDGEQVDTMFNIESKEVICFGADSTITYTIPEISEGQYDVYLNMGKAVMTGGSTMVTFAINDNPAYAVPTEIAQCAEDKSDIYSTGIFLMKSNVELQTGDNIIITGLAGHEIPSGDKMVSYMPSIGDIAIYPAGTEVAVGYDGGTIENINAVDDTDALSGLNIAWLGSSVTYGLMANGYSMADAIEENHSAVKCYKHAISGTTLVNENSTSYVERMKQIDLDQKLDLFVVQLSTNDATGGKELGSISESTERADFDDKTIAGAMEYIISYVDETWECPVIFYTGTFFESKEYGKMVELLFEIQEKWDIGVIDLWNDQEMLDVVGTEEYDNYMSDPVHPTHDGYEKWWTPKFEQYLTEYVEAELKKTQN